ncbi:MAG: spermidine/putrescine transport system substrate-binding protein [Oceanotoga sp.]|jgi:spermidine/putrescine transport system substrate-binding protein|uniref:Spermidine/putrescine-binding protein n=1 Tax=Oceanotoga teriensis TaxID=515440 RepID=A0AA45C4X2_9BACT|nr:MULTISPECIES: extracellular solute-binding protein [Oceanotoga]MDN5342819.1 spermidine/putrescine transport system substrate-binding protein [Oceanotoga sp.]PWJ87523.1 spermidine/putrescine-binding protein [Oceanotoga teriensis]
MKIKWVMTLLILISFGLIITLNLIDNKEKLYIFNWSYYIPNEVLREFEKEYDVKVIYDVFASNEEMFAKIMITGGVGYDIVFPSGDYTSIMIKLDLLEKLDKEKIPNMKYLDNEVLKKIKYDEGLFYSVPYVLGAAGIAVNKTYVKNYEKDWDIFLDERYKNRMTMLDDMREVLGAALKTLDYSVNTKDKRQLEEAANLVNKWKENILKFDAESFAKGFSTGEFWIVQGYAENIFLELEENMRENIDYFIPKSGGAMYMDSMVMLKSSKNKELGYKFLNFIQRPDIYAKIVDYLELPSINIKSREIREITPKYSIADLKNNEFKEDLGENVEIYNQIWQKIKLN